MAQLTGSAGRALIPMRVLDVRRLLPQGLLSDGLAAGIGRAFHVKNGRVVTTPSGNKVSQSNC